MIDANASSGQASKPDLPAMPDVPAASIATDPAQRSGVPDDFLLAWQAKLQGSTAAVKVRLLCYLPFIYPLLYSYPEALALDLQCGRGDWLELLKEAGFVAQGVDTDLAQLDYCRQRSLTVSALPALQALQTSAAESYALVSGLSLAETLPFETLRQVVQEALRVLKPGGLLILQAVNPENIVATTNEGFLIPARGHTLPKALLAFLPEHTGFVLTKAVPLHEQFSLLSQKPVSLLGVLNDPSPFYAVVAQKSAAGMALPPVINAFDQEYGLSLETLAALFDQQLDLRFKAAAQATQEAADAATRANDALAAIHGSYAYRAAAPLRWLEQQREQLDEEGVAVRVVAFGQKIRRLFLSRVLTLVTGRAGLGCVQQWAQAALDRQAQEAAKVAAERQALLAEQRKIPLDPAIVQHAYQTRERLETLNPEAQAIYEQLRSAAKPDKQAHK